ncbi:MAG: glycosyl hydrolase family 18 [Lachnospiraceae bacterium]|nr:glycosyl hydrolase family 18 [Lachnospiraceae bacterium]
MEKKYKNRNLDLKDALPKDPKWWLAIAAVLVLIVVGIAIYIYKYAPTSEHLELSKYYNTVTEDEAVTFLNGELKETEDDASYGHCVVVNASPYIELSFLKENLDDGYVYDQTAGILRYTTDTDVISVNLGDSAYTCGRESTDMGKAIIVEQYGATYLSLDFVMVLTDVNYELTEGTPNRVVLQTAGYEKSVATLKKDMALRQFGGPKSKILKDGEKGETVTIVESYGKWVRVLTSDGVLGCLKSKYLIDKTDETVEARLEERTYNHISMDETVVMGWHQVTSQAGNTTLSEAIASTTGMNVISPTWFQLADNSGGISSYASMDYVTECHNQGIQVWGLVSNFEKDDVSSSTVLNNTASRDNLINNIVAQAVAYNLDGINIDFELLDESCADGFIEFIRELSIKCENNDLVLSIDNYVPSEYHSFYNYKEQGKYADYVVIMAYDEHYAGSEEAGSNASLSFVTKGVEDMLEYVSADQVILGMPFYTRVWVTEGDALKCSTLYMSKTYEYLEKHNATVTWMDEYGQYYAEFTEDGKTYQVWVEDAESLAKKLQVMQSSNLAGGAFWKLTLETDSIWEVISQYK